MEEPFRRLMAEAFRLKGLGRTADALPILKMALRVAPGSPDACIHVAQCYALLDRKAYMLRYLEKAGTCGPLSVDHFASISEMLMDMCEFEQALAWQKKCLHDHPRQTSVHERLYLISRKASEFVRSRPAAREQYAATDVDEGFLDFVAAHGNAMEYLSRNPDVAAAGLGAYAHWLSHGLWEGRIFPGIEVNRNPKPGINTTRPWRYFAFRGTKLGARRVGPSLEPISYKTVVQSWTVQKEVELIRVQRRRRSLLKGPMISIIVPVYDTRPDLLRATIESVRKQIYQNWELCLADDCSPNSETRKVLLHYQASDTRIRVVFRKENGGISAATNSALKIAKGEFVGFLDHDDLLDEWALLCVVQELRMNKRLKIVYTDEDKIDESGSRRDPHFKPDWNRELFYSCNYISHFCVSSRSLVRSAGGLRTSFNGAQDYDLLLRCIEKVGDKQIKHIPKVLYSWRIVAGSTAMSADAKPYTWEAGRRALVEHLRRTSDPYSHVERGPFPNTFKPCWIPDRQPLVSIIMPTRDNLVLVKQAVESILQRTAGCRYELLLVDNGSTDPDLLEWFRAICTSDSRVRVCQYDYPFNYSAINNWAVRRSQGSIVAFLNDDVEALHPEWLQEMAALASRADVGCVGAKLVYPDGSLQHAGVIVGVQGVAGHACHKWSPDEAGYFGRLQLRQEYTAVTAACMVVRRSVFEEVKGFNEAQLPVSFNDVDLCLKVKASGYRNIWTPFARLIHHESASRGRDDTPEKTARAKREVAYMMKKWRTNLFVDGAYNPNLSLARADFSYEEPRWTF